MQFRSWLEILGSALIDAFTICAFVALLTVAILHFLQPLLRKVAQDITLTANSVLPDQYFKEAAAEKESDTGATDERDADNRLTDADMALRAAFGTLPEWMRDSTGPGASWDSRKWVHDNMKEIDNKDRVSLVAVITGFFLRKDWRTRTVGFRTPATFLPDELFMRTVESEARAVLAAPTQNPYLFALLTATAPKEARTVIAYLGDLARVSPSDAARLATPEGFGQQTAAGIASAENAVTAAAESWLDRFQLALATKSFFVTRATAILAGILLVWVIGELVGWNERRAALAAIGAAGGLLGLLVNDAARAVFLDRRR